jgi:hypothetical protein|tara:strand:- start:6582 stop:7193 length:612 start_codon:yes stop_codon:yes gene_type:complete
MIIHTYGDSHATHHGGWTSIQLQTGISIKTNHIPGKLAYSFGRDKMQVVSGVNSGDVVIFCFGEIDCRCHINKYEPDWKESIDNIVTEYIENVQRNVVGLSNVTTCIYNVVPPLERENPINFAAERGSGVPAAGSDKDRQDYTLYMNKKLKERCKKYGYIFFDVYKKYCDEKGFIKVELSDDNCHIRDPKYMIEFLNNNILNK